MLCFTDVSMDMPDELDLSHLRGAGLQPGEEELPEKQEDAEPGSLGYIISVYHLCQQALSGPIFLVVLGPPE